MLIGALAVGVAAPLVISDTALAQASGRPWLGLELAARKDGKAGATVRHVVRSSPADVAGLKDGDAVVALDGKPVKSPNEVIGEVRARKTGDVVELTFERGSIERKAKVKLETFPGAEEILRRERLGQFAPALTGIVAAQGTASSLASMRGKVVVLDFWAGWCTVCKLVAPVLNGWHEKLGAQGLIVLGVSSDAATVASKAIDDFGIKYAVGLDKDQSIFPAYGITSLPTMFVIDKRGVVRGAEIGFDPAGLVRAEALVKALLAEKAPED